METVFSAIESSTICRRNAREAQTEADRDMWNDRAEHWLNLAGDLVDEDEGGDPPPCPPAVALALPDLEPDYALIYSRVGMAPEGYVRVGMERTSAGVRVVLELGHACYRLEPTVFVLESVSANLRTITAEEVRTGRATIGRVGLLALEVLGRAPRLAA